jgi:hypothetical protein
MKVTYLGDREDFRAHGFYFHKKNDFTVDVSDSEKTAQKKFIMNRYFHTDHKDNVSAPAYYVREIVRIPVGGRKPPVIRKQNINVFGGMTKEDCLSFVAAQGGRVFEGEGMPPRDINYTHYIIKNPEKIRDITPGETDGTVTEVGVFRKKSDGKPFDRPDKVFHGDDCLEQAKAYMEEKDIDPESRFLMKR